MRLECAKEYYEEKLSQGRTDPIAMLLLSTLKKEIDTLEAKYEKEKNRSRGRAQLSRTRQACKHIRQALYRLWYYKNRGLSCIFALARKEGPQTKAVAR
jgi:hypothetical protein